MKKEIVGILVVTLLIATTIIPVVGSMNVERKNEINTTAETKTSVELRQVSRRFLPTQLPPWLLSLFNGDWNYWDNEPHMFSIPDGNIGIGTNNPTSKLEVIGNVEADGFTINGVPVGTSTDSYWSEGEKGNIYYDGNVDIDGILSVTGGIDPPYVVFDPLPNNQYPHEPPLNPVEGTVYYKASNDELYVYKIPDGWVQLAGGSGGADTDWLPQGASSTADIYHEGGNVGIGTNSPDYGKLQINSEGDESQNEWWPHPLSIWGDEYSLYMGVDSDDDVAYLQSVKTGLWVAPIVLNARGGNVGINTVNPTEALTIGDKYNRGHITFPWTMGGGAQPARIYVGEPGPSFYNAQGNVLEIKAGDVCSDPMGSVKGGELQLYSGLGAGHGASDIVFYTGYPENPSTRQTHNEVARFLGTGQMRLQPLDTPPSNPSVGDIYVDNSPTNQHIWCYLRDGTGTGTWKQLDL